MSPSSPLDRDFLVETCRDLVRINSINPVLVPGAPGEAEIASYVAERLKMIGLEVTRHEPAPGRVSVVGRLPGSGGDGGRSLMLNAHVDTVGVEGMEDPFSGDVRGGRLYGRGAYDMKASLAACIAAARTVAESGIPLRGDLVVAAVADEEYGSLGTADLVTHTLTDAAIVTEPTALEICLAHKGYVWLKVETFGRAAHGSRFEQGVDANMRMGRVLTALAGLEEELRARAPHPLVGPPSLHAALLEGGTGLSTYAAKCRLQIERRTVPGEDEAQVLREVQSLLDGLSSSDPSFQARLESFFVRPPFEVARDADLVMRLADAATAVLGKEPRFVGDSPWMDSALLAGAGVETVVFGPAGTGAHAEEEWVDVESMERCAAVLAATAVSYCA
jgi:acetylornithine deacetylase